MADPAALRALLARLEAAEGPDREVDRALHVAVGLDMGEEVHLGALLNAYTASIDAAVALVERRGYGWQIDRDDGCYLSDADDVFDLVKAATPPLSLCAALVRAEIMRAEWEAANAD